MEATAVKPADWLRRLYQVAWQQDSLRGLNAVLGVIGEAVGALGVVLWQEEPDRTGRLELAPAAAWSGPGAGAARRSPPQPDPTTLAALRTGSLALPAAAGGRPAPGVIGALPLTQLDGRRGVLSLTGRLDLTGPAFDLAADLVEVLPGLCAAIRDRQTLTLLGECQRLLHQADLDSPRDPLEPDQLRGYLVRLCRSVAATLDCADVTVYLADPDDPVGDAPTVVASARGPVPDGQPSDPDDPDGDAPPPVATARGRVPDGQRSDPASPGPADGVVIRRLVSGRQVWGTLRCTGPRQPPFHFTGMDAESLGAVTVQLSQYWNNWLHRRRISAENSAWMRLATGIHAFNQRVSAELSRRAPRARIIDDIALKVVLDVVPECSRVDLLDITAGLPPDAEVTFAHRAARGAAGDLDGEHAVLPESVRELLRDVHCTGAARTGLVEPGVTGNDGGTHRTAWCVGASIGFGGRSDGVLAAFGPVCGPACGPPCGPAGGLPPNAREVCEIIGDQLALYRHVDRTMAELKDTGARLKATVRAQSDTLANLQHQLASPLLSATYRIDGVIKSTHFDGRTDTRLRAVRGLCRRASRVALSAGVFAALSRGQPLAPKEDRLGPEDILRILIACADDAQLLSDQRQQITFEVDRDSVRTLGRRLVRADRSFLDQSVGNLLDNAAKYSYPDSQVDIRANVAGGRFTVTVANSGLPIAPDDVPHCIEQNWRGPAASTFTGEGSGLGLWIVDNLMHSMRGSVDIQPSGDLTTVALTFPLG